MSTTGIHLGPEDAGARVSAEEFAAADFDRRFRYERVQGRLVVMSPAGPEHRSASRYFRRKLGGYWDEHPELIDDVDVESWLVTSPHSERIPDISVFLRGPSSREAVPHRVPELIFEFISGNRADQERDYIDKRAEYFAVGVAEYVIVDRFKQAVLILTRSADHPHDFAERQLRPPQHYTSPLLPGLEIDLAEVFAEMLPSEPE